MLAAFAAGWVDAVVGGGGLIQLPALLIALPDSTPPASILGTNKVSLGVGDRDQLDHLRDQDQTRLADHRCRWSSASAVGSALGAQLARFLPREYFTPIVLVALIGVGIYTWRRPELGLVTERKHDGRTHYVLTAAIGLGVGAYDGILGPGTGSFFVILLVGVLGYGFLEASAKAKIANLVTNLAAIAVFAAQRRDPVAARADDGRGQPGRRLPRCPDRDQQGQRFVRRVFLVVRRRAADRAAGVRRRRPAAQLTTPAVLRPRSQADQAGFQPGQAGSGAAPLAGHSRGSTDLVQGLGPLGRGGGRGQPQSAERQQGRLHLPDQLGGGGGVARVGAGHVGRLGDRHLRLAVDQPGGQPVAQDPVPPQLSGAGVASRHRSSGPRASW